METDLVLVETLITYRIRYVVEVPKGKVLWALDTVTCEQAKEFSQECLGEQIFSYRVVDQKEVLVMCDRDNGYTQMWPAERKFNTFVTLLEE